MRIVLYTKENCPRCFVMRKKMELMGINFTEVDDEEKLSTIGEKEGIKEAPILEINNTFFGYSAAIEKIKQIG